MATSGKGELYMSNKEVACDSSSCPFDPFYAHKKDQFLYDAKAIDAAGMMCGAEITSIAVKIAEVPPVIHDLRIAASWTTDTTLNGFVTKPLPTVVYGPSNLKTDSWSVGDWITIDLDTPIPAWNGSDNLLLELSLDDQNDTAGSGGGLYLRETGTSIVHEGGYTHTSTTYPYAGLNNNVHNGDVAAVVLYWQ